MRVRVTYPALSSSRRVVPIAPRLSPLIAASPAIEKSQPSGSESICVSSPFALSEIVMSRRWKFGTTVYPASLTTLILAIFSFLRVCIGLIITISHF